MLRKGRAFHLVFLLVTLLGAGFLQFFETNFFGRLQLQSDDWVAERSRKAPVHPALVYIAVDEHSQQIDPELDVEDLAGADTGASESDRRALRLMGGRWPWNREVYALIIEKLLAAGARSVALDFTLPKTAPGDEVLNETVTRHADRVVVAGNIVDSQAQGGGSRTFTPPAVSAVPFPLREKDVIAFDNFPALVDTKVRGAVFQDAVNDVDQQASADISMRPWLSLAAAAVKKSGYPADIPADFRIRRIRFAGPVGTFRPMSAYEIFAPRYWESNFKKGEFFRDKIVIVGPYGNWQQDEHPTTLGIMPGPELHLNAMNALLTGEFCAMTSQLTAAICLVGAALIAWLIGIITHRPDSRLLCGLGIPALWWWMAIVVYEKQGYFIPTVAPTVVFLFIALSSMVADQVFERVEKARVRRTLERYVSKNVVGGLLERRDEFATGVVMPVTVLFSDVRNFTRFSAQTEPHALVAQLNEYFTAMVECVFHHGGTVDKFMGDAVMAVWGNAMSKGIETDARDAARCAFAMREALAALNARWKSEGRSEFEIGIALNHGRAVVGDIGSPNKMEFTVIGDAVNIAWRLQECTKDHPREIIVGDTVAGLLDGEFQTASAGSIRVGDEIDVPYSIVKLA